MPEPEHFAATANRLFVYLREIPMLDPTSPIGANTRDHDDPSDRPQLMSAEDHYARGSELLRKAGADLVPFADMHAITTLARTHFAAAQAAAVIWPAPPGGYLVEENTAMAHEIVRLLPVVHAAREYLTASAGDQEAGAEYGALAAAVKKAEAGA